jgi:hypothetical protein
MVWVFFPPVTVNVKGADALWPLPSDTLRVKE